MAEKTENTIFIDLLEQAGVPHTRAYSMQRFSEMPFQSLFGLSKLLGEYGVESRGIRLSNPAEISELPTPFIARTAGGLIIVTGFGDDGRMHYLSQGEAMSMPVADFAARWKGEAFQIFPHEDAAEPGYAAHRRTIFFDKAKGVALKVMAVLMLVFLFVANGLYAHVSTVLLTLFSLGGLYVSYLLEQKSLNIHNPSADRVCRVIQEGGCDKVLATKASTFFGIFSWSEVGLTYFSVTLLTLLFFPSAWAALALCNLCCLPFSFWSVWYQRFRARHWCTLCLCVQATLWALFFCFLGGGWLAQAFHITWTLIALLMVYALVLLSLNRVLPMLASSADENAASDTPDSSTSTL